MYYAVQTSVKQLILIWW